MAKLAAAAASFSWAVPPGIATEGLAHEVGSPKLICKQVAPNRVAHAIGSGSSPIAAPTLSDILVRLIGAQPCRRQVFGSPVTFGFVLYAPCLKNLTLLLRPEAVANRPEEVDLACVSMKSWSSSTLI
jgi:hypothetical protein